MGPALGSGAQHRVEGSPFLNIWAEVNAGGDSGQKGKSGSLKALRSSGNAHEVPQLLQELVLQCLWDTQESPIQGLLGPCPTLKDRPSHLRTPHHLVFVATFSKNQGLSGVW